MKTAEFFYCAACGLRLQDAYPLLSLSLASDMRGSGRKYISLVHPKTAVPAAPVLSGSGYGCCFGHSIPSKDANIEIIYKTLFGVKKNLSTTFPHENVDNTVRTDFPAQIFDTRYGKIKFFQPKYCALKVIHISTI